MTDFNEAQATNLYLIDQLVVARKRIEVLETHIETLVQHIETLAQDLKQSSQLLNACVAYMS
jgi:archaellum component FlaC